MISKDTMPRIILPGIYMRHPKAFLVYNFSPLLSDSEFPHWLRLTLDTVDLMAKKNSKNNFLWQASPYKP